MIMEGMPALMEGAQVWSWGGLGAALMHGL